MHLHDDGSKRKCRNYQTWHDGSYRDEGKQTKHELCEAGRDGMWTDAGSVYYQSESGKENVDSEIGIRKRTMEANGSSFESKEEKTMKTLSTNTMMYYVKVKGTIVTVRVRQLKLCHNYGPFTGGWGSTSNKHCEKNLIKGRRV